MDKQLSELVTKLVELVEQGVDLTIDQLPLVATEILNWVKVEHSVNVLILLALSVSLFVLAALGYKLLMNQIKSQQIEHPGWLLLTIVGTTSAVVSLAHALLQVIYVIKAYVAPRLVLVEYLKKLIS